MAGVPSPLPPSRPLPPPPPRAIVVMGVSGCGKSAVGRLLAQRLPQCGFVEGDDFHPPANVAKMRAGTPLTDSDREPWLAVLAERISSTFATNERVVVSCSALKRAYRDVLRRGTPSGTVGFVLLDPPRAELQRRLEQRAGDGTHFMAPSLLDSQLEALEVPDCEEELLLAQFADEPFPTVDEIVGSVLQRLAEAEAKCQQ